ncbi:MAG: hemagglutinin repeat-containing protein, partial [Sporomusa sp.]
GSTVGSIGGSVTIEAGKDLTALASDVIAGQDIRLTGETVTIESQDNIYDNQERHEYKKSGLTVSLGGATVDAINSVVAPLERATQVHDDRLAALYGYKAYDELTDQDTKTALEGIKDPKNSLGINVSIGSQKSESQAQSSTKLAQGSNVAAQGDVSIEATKEDITIKGSSVAGDNVSLKAQKNINIIASENTNVTEESAKSSKGSVGVSISVSGISGVNAGYAQGKEEIEENSVTYNPSSVAAKDTLTLESSQDTNIIGSEASGNTVRAEVGGDLHIESLQTKETYEEKSSSSGLGISAGITAGKIGKAGITGSAVKGKIESDYESVTDQAGIFAGDGGFDINVGGNTDLKGAVISSEADAEKNKLSTDTLTFSDVENKAEYTGSSTGYGYSSDKGFSPIPSIPVSGDAESTTKSAISHGTIEVRSGNTDVGKINRNTDQALNALGKIFDKENVEEKQELVNLFSQEANKAIGDLAESMRDRASTPEEKAKWGEGGEYKALLHAVTAGITSSLSGNGFASGAVGDGLSQLAQGELSKITDKNLRLIASAAIGAAAAKVVSGNAQVGAGAAYDGVKYNDYIHRPTYEGAIIYYNGDKDGKGSGYYKVIDGEETYLPEGIKPGETFWEADGKYDESGRGLGYEHIKGADGKDIYFTWQEKQIVVG